MRTILIRFLCALLTIVTISACEKEELNKIPVADAGNASSIQLPVDSVRLTGTGTDQNGHITAYLWSQVSGPNGSNIVHPGSASTIVKGLVAGSYLFQLMVVDNEGATGLDTLSLKVLPSLIKTLSLQPANNPTEKHILGNGSGYEGSHHGAAELGASAWTIGGTPIAQRGLFKFDFTSIPANANIISAKLSLYSNPVPLNGDLIHANSGPNNSMLIQRVVSPWITSSVTWTSQPGTTTIGQIAIPHTSQPFLDLIDVDVTDLVKTMVNSNANFGLVIRLQNESIYNSRLFASSFYSNASKHPKIVIQYQ